MGSFNISNVIIYGMFLFAYKVHEYIHCTTIFVYPMTNGPSLYIQFKTGLSNVYYILLLDLKDMFVM